MQEQIRQIIADATLNDLDGVANDAKAEDVSNWDSLAQLTIIANIESEFGITFEIDEISELTNLPAIFAAVAAKTEA